jgi:hypothetical protein
VVACRRKQLQVFGADGEPALAGSFFWHDLGKSRIAEKEKIEKSLKNL